MTTPILNTTTFIYAANTILLLLSFRIGNVISFQPNYLSSLHSNPNRAYRTYRTYRTYGTFSSSNKLLQSTPTSTETSELVKVAPESSSESVEKFYDVLKSCGRDINAEPVQEALTELQNIYNNNDIDARMTKSTSSTTDIDTITSFDYEGDWLMETLPSFLDLQGHNSDGDSIYTMGRLSFNMIQPSNVLCSVQKVTQHIHKLDESTATATASLPDLIPKSLRKELEEDASGLRTFRTDVHFTIESNGVQGILQTDGYTIPNPTMENRYTCWFTGGKCFAVNGKDKDTRRKWRQAFGTELKLKKRERFQLWMAKLLMGAEPSSGMLKDDSLQYVMKRPIGGHSTAFLQVLYMDDKTRITQGNRGTVVAVTRL